MKIRTIMLAGIFLVGNSVGYAETNFLKGTMVSGSTALGDWTAGDHMGAAKRYEEEFRILQAEARGMEHVETQILPYLEVEAIKEAGVPKLIDRRFKEAEEKMKLASWHHQEAMRLFAAKEANMPAATHSQKAVTTGMSQTPPKSFSHPYLKYDWMEEEALLGW